MRVLFAAPDRDLLTAYKRLLNADGFDTDTAFDGTQVVRKLSEERYELLIIMSDIPRIPIEQIVRSSTAKGIPVIEMVIGEKGTDPVPEGKSARMKMPLPFTPAELSEGIRKITGVPEEAEKAGVSYE